MSVGSGWWNHVASPERIIQWEDVSNILYENGLEFKRDKTTFTDDDMTRGGCTSHPDPPSIEAGEQLRWMVIDGTFQWHVEKLSSAMETALLFREEEFGRHQWRVDRYHRQVRMGITPEDNIEELDKFFEALCDITKQSGWPDDIEWPNDPRNQALIDAEGG